MLVKTNKCPNDYVGCIRSRVAEDIRAAVKANLIQDSRLSDFVFSADPGGGAMQPGAQTILSTTAGKRQSKESRSDRLYAKAAQHHQSHANQTYALQPKLSTLDMKDSIYRL
jgi:hypothetical protein